MRTERRSTLLVLGSLVALVVIAATGCKHEPDEFIPLDPIGGGGITCEWPGAASTPANCDPGTIYFQEQVMPIIMRSCALTDPNNSDLTCHHTVVEGDQDMNFTNSGTCGGGGRHCGSDPGQRSGRSHASIQRNTTYSQEISIIEQWFSQGSNLNSCLNCDTAQYTYSGTIGPMVALHCGGGCHSGVTTAGGLNLVNATILKDNAARSWYAISGCTDPHMPPVGPPLPDCKLQQFYNWMINGADITN